MVDQACTGGLTSPKIHSYAGSGHWDACIARGASASVACLPKSGPQSSGRAHEKRDPKRRTTDIPTCLHGDDVTVVHVVQWSLRGAAFARFFKRIRPSLFEHCPRHSGRTVCSKASSKCLAHDIRPVGVERTWNDGIVEFVRFFLPNPEHIVEISEGLADCPLPCAETAGAWAVRRSRST